MIDLLKIAVWIVVRTFRLLAWIFSKAKLLMEEANAAAKAAADPESSLPWDPPGSIQSTSGQKRPRELAPATQTSRATSLSVRLKNIAERAEKLRDSIAYDRACERLIPAIESHGAKAKAFALMLEENPHSMPSGFESAVSFMEIAQETFETMVTQRSASDHSDIRERLGDADAFAMACYQPIIDFAQANDVPLRSLVPVAMLDRFSLSTWVGFAPTGIAPLFLPKDFFDEVAWWPALAHEIAHDVLVATTNADEELRQQLGLASEKEGQTPFGVLTNDVTMAELERVTAGWFEEIFADVFGTMMLGPAYVVTMSHLFQSPDEPSEVSTVGLDETGAKYGVHPPRHIRVLMCCDLLSRLGHSGESNDLMEKWEEMHGFPEAIEFPVPGGTVSLPISPIRDTVGSIVERLTSEPLRAFDGHNLAGIPGLDYGPHRHQEALRASKELDRGVVPKEHSALAVIAGLVMAWHKNPGNESRLLDLARHAIAGVSEWVDHYDSQTEEALPGDDVALSAKESFVLHTIFAPPRSLAIYRASLPTSPKSTGAKGKRSVAPRLH